MYFSRLLLLLFSVMALTEAALGFDRCETFFTEPGTLCRELEDAAILRTPVKYYQLARNIKLVTTGPGENFIPFAADLQGTKLIVFPPPFSKAMCKIAIAFYLIGKDNQENALEEAADSAAKCIDLGGPPNTCIVGFADELAERYGKAFARLPVEDQEMAFILFENALHQLIMHEYAHHFLDHFASIKTQKVTRLDSEFEADLFAVLNGIQSAEPPSAMNHFFMGMEKIEGHIKKSRAPDYQSSNCRVHNIDTISTFIGLGGMLLVDSAYGGGLFFRKNSQQGFRDFIATHFSKDQWIFMIDPFTQIGKVALRDASDELRQLCRRIEKDIDFLFSKENNLDVVKAKILLGDLTEMSMRFRYMNGITAKCIAVMLKGWRKKRYDITPLMGDVEQMLNAQSITDNFLCEDFGALLEVQGTVTLFQRVDLTAQSRMDLSFPLFLRAVSYNPKNASAWGSLAMISFKKGDCAAAASYADRCVATLTQNNENKAFQFIATDMKRLSSDPEACRAAARSLRFP
jgi:hypothetical protein